MSLRLIAELPDTSRDLGVQRQHCPNASWLIMIAESNREHHARTGLLHLQSPAIIGVTDKSCGIHQLAAIEHLKDTIQ